MSLRISKIIIQFVNEELPSSNKEHKMVAKKAPAKKKAVKKVSKKKAVAKKPAKKAAKKVVAKKAAPSTTELH
jgi:hypothetical protein